jgi:DNA-binding MarR family transcriptional regulator
MPDRIPSFYRPDSYKPEESVMYLMRRITTAVALEVERQLEPLDLTNAQWVPLFKLHQGHASTAAELARDCHIDAGAVTRMLDRLEDKGLVRRVRSSEDRRVVRLELTDEGRAKAQNIPAVLCQVQNAHLRGFSRDELDTLKGLLRRVMGNANELQGAAREQEQGKNP